MQRIRTDQQTADLQLTAFIHPGFGGAFGNHQGGVASRSDNATAGTGQQAAGELSGRRTYLGGCATGEQGPADQRTRFTLDYRGVQGCRYRRHTEAERRTGQITGAQRMAGSAYQYLLRGYSPLRLIDLRRLDAGMREATDDVAIAQARNRCAVEGNKRNRTGRGQLTNLLHRTGLNRQPTELPCTQAQIGNRIELLCITPQAFCGVRAIEQHTVINARRFTQRQCADLRLSARDTRSGAVFNHVNRGRTTDRRRAAGHKGTRSTADLVQRPRRHRDVVLRDDPGPLLNKRPSRTLDHVGGGRPAHRSRTRSRATDRRRTDGRIRMCGDNEVAEQPAVRRLAPLHTGFQLAGHAIDRGRRTDSGRATTGRTAGQRRDA